MALTPITQFFRSSKNELSQIIDSAQLRKVPIQFTTRSELDSLLDKRPHQVKT